MFAFELDEHGNKVLDSFYTARDAAFADKTGHRHKFKRAFLKQKAKETGNDNINIPAFSLHAMPSGEERRYDYIGSRWFYCTWYEKLATQTAEFKQLVALMDDGYNLCICGYDGYAPTTTLMEHYLDTSRPFGHEMVLLCLLTIKESKDYPWNVYRRTHAQLYE